jgi:hypothetical protein
LGRRAACQGFLGHRRDGCEALDKATGNGRGQQCIAGADHWLGVLAGVTDRFTLAIRHLEAALARHREIGSRPLTALTQEAYGRVLSRRGQAADIERAHMLASSAMHTADELGLAAITDRPAPRA